MGFNDLSLGYQNSTDAELMQKTIQAVPKDLLMRVLKKLKPDYEIFNYELPYEIPESNAPKLSDLASNLWLHITCIV